MHDGSGGRDGEIAEFVHDLNNVLTGIKASAQYLLKFVLPSPEGPDSAALAEYLALIDASVGKASGILGRFVSATLGQEAPPARDGPPRPSGAGKALVLDQDRMMRAAVAKLLELSGWEVSGEECLEGLSGADLVILDPRGRPPETLRRLRDASPRARIILTPSRSDEAGEAGLADRVLGKPYAREELERAIRGA